MDDFTPEPVDFVPVFEDEEEPPAVTVPAAPKGDAFKRRQPKVSETETITIPSADTLTLPKVIDEGQPEFKPQPVDFIPDFSEDAAPAAKPEQPGVLSNLGRGIAERGLQLVGGVTGVIGDIAEAGGDYADMYLGKPVWDENGFSWRRLTEEEVKGRSSWITKMTDEVRKGLEDPDLGYNPSTTWEDVKSAPISNIVPFALEQGIVSLADMYLAVKNAPAYVAEQTGEISRTRAKNEGRDEPTFGDIVKSLPAAAISAWMEKIGTSKMLGLDDVALTELKQLPPELLKTLAVEGATEAAQEAASIGGEQAFTDKGIDWWQAAERTLQAGLVGSIFGPTVKAPIAGLQIATAPKTGEDVVEEEVPPADTTQASPANPPVVPGTKEVAAPDTTTPGGKSGDPAQPAKVPAGELPDNGVTVNQPGQVPADLAAGVRGAPVEEKGAIPEDDDEDVDVLDDDEVLIGTPPQDSVELDAGKQRIRDMFAEENAAVAADEIAATAANVEILKGRASADQAAAIAAAAGKTPYTGQNLGTGRTLDAKAPPEGAPQAAPLDTPIPAAPQVAEQAGPPVTPTPIEPAAKLNVGPAQVAPMPAEKPIVTPPVVAAESTVPAQQGEPAVVQATAGEPALVAETPSPLPPVETKKRKFKKPVEAAIVPAAPAEGAVAYPATVEAAPQPAEKKTISLKGDRFKKPMPPEGPGRPVERRPAAAAPAPQPTPEPAPAPSPEAERAKKLARDIGDRARQVADERKSTVSEVAEYRETVAKVAEEKTAAHKRGAEESPREYVERIAKDVHEEVERRLAPAREAADEQRVAEAELAEAHYKDVAKVKEAEASEKKMREGTAQQHERYDREGRKSPEGIRQEGWEATRDRAIKEEAKPEAERDPLLMEWLGLHREQIGRKTSAARKDEIEALKRDVQERRAQASTRKVGKAKVEAKEGAETKRARDVQKTIQDDVIAKLPPIAKESEIRRLAKQTKRGLAAVMRALYQADRTNFVNAVREALKAKGLELSGKRDWTHQSDEENLAVWGRSTEADNQKMKLEWGMARTLLEAGDHVSLKGLLGSEISTGSGSNEDAGKYSENVRGAINPAWGETEEVTAGGTVTSFSDFTTMEVDDEGNVYQARQGPGRTGRQTVVERERGRQQRAADTVQPHSFTVQYPDGRKVKVESLVMSGEAALRDNLALLSEADELYGRAPDTGSFAILRNMLTKRLIDMVGDVPVHFVSEAGMRALSKKNPAGFYMNLTDDQRARGEKPYIVIREDLSAAEQSHTLIHELVHAATSQAIRAGVRGTDKIIRALMNAFNADIRNHFTEAEMKALDLEYGFTNEAEFIAEALSNELFQAVLKKLPAPASIRASVSALGEGRVPRWWDAVIDAVNNAVGVFMGRKGHSYMDNVLTVYSQVERSSLQQRLAAKANVGSKNIFRRQARQVTAMQERLLGDVVGQASQAVQDKASNLLVSRGRTLGYKLVSSHELIRQFERLWGGANNAIEQLLNAHIRMGPRLKELRATPGAGLDSAKLEEAVVKYQKRQPVVATRLGELMNAGTGYQANITRPITDASNKHLQGKGNRRRQARAQHARLYAEFLSLPKEAQKLGRDQVDHYRKAGELEAKNFVAYALGEAVREYRLGPKLAQIGKTSADAVDWFMRDRALVDPANQTQEDKDFHRVLGNTAQTLAKVPQLKRIKGMYVPLRREGKYFINGTDKPFAKGAPAGGVIDPAADNTVLFKNEKTMQAYVDGLDRQASVTTRYYDQAGNRTTLAKTPNANKAYAVTVQNSIMEMSDNHKALRRRADELRAQGFTIAHPRTTASEMYQAAEDASPAQVKRIIHNLEQTTVGSATVTQEAVKKAVLDAQIRSMTSPGHLQSRLKRKNVQGADVDMFKALRGYNRGLASALLNYEMGPQIAEAEAEAKKLIRDRAKNNYGKSEDIHLMEIQLNEALNRIKNTNRGGHGGRVEAVKNVTFLHHLASPHYTLYNLLQPISMSLPIMSSRLNKGRTWRLVMQAYNIGAGLPSAGRAFKETGKRILMPWKQHADVDYQDYWDAAIAREPDGAQLADVIEAMARHGVGASSGLEADVVGEAGMNRAQVFVNRLVGIAKQFPEMAEAINRNTTAIASYRGFRELGMSHPEAVREAVHMVEQTQGGYDASNHSAEMSYGLVAPFSQFKKFSVTYGQMYYRNMTWAISHQDPVTQKQSRKAFVRLALMGVVFAGIYGNPLMEIAKVLVNIAAGLGWKDDDWDDDEADIQKAFANAIEWVTGSDTAGDTMSEMLFRGLTRAIDLDTANNMANDSLFLFGQPKDWDQESVYAYAMKTILGAPGELIANSVGSALTGDWAGIIPWPKAIDNVRKGLELMNKGTVNQKTGEVYEGPPGLHEGVYQALGMKPASQSRQWEGGSGSAAKALKKERAARKDILTRWNNASPAERHRIFKEDRVEWNKAHKNPADKITMDTLLRSKESRKEYRKKVEALAEEDD